MRKGLRKDEFERKRSQSGGSLSTIYEYFGDKERLFYTILEREISDFNESLQAEISITHEPNLRDFLVKFGEIFKFSGEQKSFGEITFIGDDFFALGFKNGQIGVRSIQIPGKKAVSARDFINGKRLKIGDRIS